MLAAKVGESAPAFELPGVVAGGDALRTVRSGDYAGRWLAMIFYPRDFSFVCPTELTSFSARLADFRQRGCELLGVSVDPVETHRQWMAVPPAEGGLGPLGFPLASDTAGEVARAYGAWSEAKQVATRGLFIVDPAGVLQYAVVHNLNVGRSPAEVLRVLDALRTGGLCPASWTEADGTIDPERALQPGRTLGHYRIRQRLGGGTFGTVFSAWDLHLERMVALKVLRRTLFESRGVALAEARAAARVNHPHTCTVYAVEEEDGLPLIVMEFLDGEPLSQAIARGLAGDGSLRFARQMAAGLAAAHAQHVVHGDFKPANVMITRDGLAKILDFGLSSRRPADCLRPRVDAPAASREATVEFGPRASADVAATIDVADATPSGGLRGSLAYMAPEQAMGQPATAASDVFSFGLTFFEMLTGRRALAAQSPAEILVALQSEELGQRLARTVPSVHRMHRDLLSAMLAHRPSDRLTMSDVTQSLHAGLARA